MRSDRSNELRHVRLYLHLGQLKSSCVDGYCQEIFPQ